MFLFFIGIPKYMRRGKKDPVIFYKKEEQILAILVRPKQIKKRLMFVTPEAFPMQVGIHNRSKGDIIESHRHKKFEFLKDLNVQEIFYVLEGELKVQLFDDSNNFFKEVLIKPNELLILNCGHGVSFHKKCKFFEIKQGPYRGAEEEKTPIKGVL